ncbi:MAG: hypothetical protein ACLUFU_04480 [Bacilli bacterium]
MVSKIDFIYDIDRSKKQQLIGAKQTTINGDEVKRQEYYVGLKLDINDILLNNSIKSYLGIHSSDIFMAKYSALKASGIIYFPQTSKIEFLEESDIVLDYREDMTVEDILKNALINQQKPEEDFTEEENNDLSYQRIRISSK